MVHRQHTPGQPKKKIAYIIGAFPGLTITFIDREIIEARRKGLKLVLVSIRRLPPFEIRPEIKELVAQTKYILPISWLKFLATNLYFGLTRFRIYLATLFYLLASPHTCLKDRVKTLLHFGEGVQAAGLLQSERIAHIHAHFADRAAIVALVSSRLLGISYSLTAHANDIYVAPVLLPEKVANAKFVTTCTGYNKRYLEHLTGRSIELIYHGLDLTGMTSMPLSGNGDLPLILSVGRLQEKKGFIYLLKACHLLKREGRKFKCEIIGEGPQRAKLESVIVELGLQDTVTLRGAMPNMEVMDQYRQATIFTLPCVVAGNADRDGIPNVLLEAMASRLAVVSTSISGIPEVIENGVTGLLVDPGNAEALAEALAKLLDEPNLREQLGRQGYRRIEESFDIRTNIDRLVRLLEQ